MNESTTQTEVAAPEPAQETQLTDTGDWNSNHGFALIQRQAKLLSSSELVPKAFQGNAPNCVIAIELSRRIGASPFAVMQNLDIIHGRPSWRSVFIISAINTCGRFHPLQFRMEGEGQTRSCVAHTTERGTGNVCEGPPVDMAMAKAEGWLSKNGSKWQTMPELMLRYRAATFFGRLYAPEILMGMQTADEVIDVTPVADAQRKSAAFALAKDAEKPEEGEGGK